MDKAIDLKTSRGAGAKAMRSLLKELYGEDAGMERWLLDAALAAQAVESFPENVEYRRLADEAWGRISAVLAHHLTSEDESLLPWVEARHEIPPALMGSMRKEHRELRALSRRLATVSFERDSDEKVVAAAHALGKLAVRLDDLIAGERRHLFPMMRRALFRPNHAASQITRDRAVGGTNTQPRSGRS